MLKILGLLACHIVVKVLIPAAAFFPCQVASLIGVRRPNNEARNSTELLEFRVSSLWLSRSVRSVAATPRLIPFLSAENLFVVIPERGTRIPVQIFYSVGPG
jgi:hypothetical protein